MNIMPAPIGEQLRQWRGRRRMSQLDLALEADISQRHLSFVESGRSKPGRELVLLLADKLEVPLRERNRMLLGAGYAPVFAERPLDDEEMAAVRAAIDSILDAHAPFPALAIDRRWNLVTANAAVPPLLAGAAPWLLAPPINVLRLSLHPDGIASTIVNFGEWRAHLLARLRREVDVSGDPEVAALHAELAALPAPAGATMDAEPLSTHPVLVPLRLRTELGELAFFSTTTVFGTPLDVTVSELAIEAFYPADAQTRALLQRTAAR